MASTAELSVTDMFMALTVSCCAGTSQYVVCYGKKNRVFLVS